MPFRRAFFAYPVEPSDLRTTIESSADLVQKQITDVELRRWPQMDIFGASISDEIRAELQEVDVLICDITRPNLNVYYEIGYAIGQGKAIAPVLNISFAGAAADIQKDGIFDVIGYKTYENSEDLASICASLPTTILLELYSRELNSSQPIFYLSAFRKTDFINHIASSIKDSKVHFRSFDPAEISRFSTVQILADLTSSAGILVPFIGRHIEDAHRHNIRAALVAGIAHGLERETLLLFHQTSEPSSQAADYRDITKPVRDEHDIKRLVIPFSRKALEATQELSRAKPRLQVSALQKISLGAIAAENEFRALEDYFVQTSEYLRTMRGEIRIVAGRKGSGKTAIFFMVRDYFRRSKAITIDLKPESHQLTLFREQLLLLVDSGTFDHTIAAFWNFVILSEILIALKRDIDFRAQRNSTLMSEALEIERELNEMDISLSGDFTTRLTRLAANVVHEMERMRAKGQTPRANEITNLVFKRGVGPAKQLVVKHTRSGSRIIFLFDNIDKGWATKGVDPYDVKIVRLLIEALDKVKHDLDVDDREFFSTMFLRNDVYELMVDETPDRGKEAVVRIDWTDRAKLRQVIFRRLQATTNQNATPFEDLWARYFCREVSGRNSFEYLVDHCMMRPRFLINIIGLAIANAINRAHSVVSEEDCSDAVFQHSNYLLNEFGFEIRDVSGLSSRMIHSLVGTTELVTREEILEKLGKPSHAIEDVQRAFELLLWYGVLGIVTASGKARYIYDFEYSMNRLQAEITLQGSDALFITNPALHVALRSA